MTRHRTLVDTHPRRAWYLVAMLTLANVSGFVDRQILSLLVEPMKRDLSITDTQVSLLMGVSFAVFYSVLGVPLGRLADSRSRRVIVSVGALLWSLMTSAGALARSFTQLLLLRIGVGVGEATLAPAAASAIADAFPPARRGTAMSVFMLGTFLGSGLAYALGAVAVGLVESQALWEWPVIGAIRPWQSVFLLVGLPGLLISALMLTAPEPARTASSDHAPVVPWGSLWDFLRRESRAVLLLSFGFATFAAVNYGIAAWLATFFVRTHGWTATEAGTLQGVLTMTVGVAGTLLGGVLSDRGVARGRTDAPLTVGLVACVGMLCSATAYPLVPNTAVVVTLLVLVNLFAAMPWGAAQAAIAELFPERMRGQGAAIYLLIVNLLSGVVGPTAVAVITDRVFGDSARVGSSLALTAAVGMSVAALLLLGGRRAYREALSRPRPS